MILKKIKIFILLTLALITLFAFSKKVTSNPKPTDIVVTIAPYKAFVDYLSNSSLNVEVLVAPDASPHSFEPTPKDIIELSKAKAWLLSGEPFEPKLLSSLKQSGSNIQAHSMLEHLPLLASSCDHTHHHHKHSHECDHHCHHELNLKDPHVWLSPELAKKQVAHLVTFLSKLFPEQKETFKSQSIKLQKELDLLSQEIKAKLQDKVDSSILVSHGAFAYFCKEFDLHQLMIETKGGQEPSSQELTELLEAIQQQSIHTVYSQIQYNPKAAKRISDILHLDYVEINPYDEDYFNNLKKLADNIAKN